LAAELLAPAAQPLGNAAGRQARIIDRQIRSSFILGGAVGRDRAGVLRLRRLDDRVGPIGQVGSSLVSHGNTSFGPSTERAGRSFRRAAPKVARPDAALIGPRIHRYCYASARRKAMTAIARVHARTILDSRGNPTVE